MTVPSNGAYIHQTITLSNEGTTSIYVKSDNLTGEFYLVTADGSLRAQTVTDEWTRVSLTSTPSSSSFRVWLRLENAGDSIYIWGAQLEEKSFSTSYIPNHGVSGGVTRLADVCNNSGSAQDFNSEQGTLYAEISALADDGTNRIFGLSNNSNFNESIILRYSAVSNRISAQVRKSGSYEFTMNYDSIDAKTPLKVAFKYKQNDFSLWVNGFEIDTRSSGDIISELDTLSFSFVGGNNFYGKVRELQVFTEALTDEQLQKLTTI